MADLIWTVDPPLMVYLFREPATWRRFFAGEWAREDGCLGHGSGHVVVGKEGVLGILISHEAESFDRRVADAIAYWPDEHDADLVRHLNEGIEALGRLFPHVQPGGYYVLALAVDQSSHKQGIGKRLMAVAEEQARAHGCARVHLDVDAENPAVGFYRRLGMQVAIETRLPWLDDAHGVGTHFHMVRSLDG